MTMDLSKIDQWFAELRGFSQTPTPAKNFRAKLFRTIVKDLGLNQYRWLLLEKRYVNDPANGLDVRTGRKQHMAQVRFRRVITRSALSEQGLELALKFLNPVEVVWIDNGVELVWQNGTRTVHVVRPSEIEA